jgi:hypothetical protein
MQGGRLQALLMQLCLGDKIVDAHTVLMSLIGPISTFALLQNYV